MGRGAGRIYGGFDEGPIPSELVDVDTSAFDGLLSEADDDVQKALETLDDVEVNVVLDGDAVIFHGPGNTGNEDNGNWRMIISGNDLNFERREAGAWIKKGAWKP